MSLFSKPPLHARVMAHPIMGWAAVGLVALSAIQVLGTATAGVVQALRRKPRLPDIDQPQ
jgi:hypothetical protein